jgi:hypothetical protein
MRGNIILFLLACLPFIGNAQYNEFGVAAGTSHYQGDLSSVITFDNIDIGLTRGAVGVLGRMNLNRFLSLRGGLTYGQVAGDDRLTNNAQRNLRFKSDIFEASFIAEFNIFGYDPVYSGKKFSPYLFMGGAGYYFNPKTDYNGRDVALQPLGTEGQGRPGYDAKYSLFSIAVPVGGGLKFALGDTWTVGIEFGARKIFHDYLDDVSGTYAAYEDLITTSEIAGTVAYRSWELTDESPASVPVGGNRGNEKFVDWYYFSMMSLTYHLPTSKRQRGKRRRGKEGNQMGCPSW